MIKLFKRTPPIRKTASLEEAEQWIRKGDALCNKIGELDKKIGDIQAQTNRIEKRLGYDLSYCMNIVAKMESAEYANKYMAKCIRCTTSKELRELSIKEVTNEGLFLEFGVYSGASINQMARLRPQNTFYGFDCFSGLPETWRNNFVKGAFKRENLPEVVENVELVVGYFEDTLPSFIEEHCEDIAFIHVDCDLYSSTKTIFEHCGERIKSGTIIVFDEFFNYPSWQDNEYRAFMEYIDATGIKYEYFAFNPNHQQVACRIL